MTKYAKEMKAGRFPKKEIDTKELLKSVKKIRKAEQTKRYEAAKEIINLDLRLYSNYYLNARLDKALKIAAGLIKTK